MDSALGQSLSAVQNFLQGAAQNVEHAVGAGAQDVQNYVQQQAQPKSMPTPQGGQLPQYMQNEVVKPAEQGLSQMAQNGPNMSNLLGPNIPQPQQIVGGVEGLANVAGAAYNASPWGVASNAFLSTAQIPGQQARGNAQAQLNPMAQIGQNFGSNPGAVGEAYGLKGGQASAADIVAGLATPVGLEEAATKLFGAASSTFAKASSVIGDTRNGTLMPKLFQKYGTDSYRFLANKDLIQRVVTGQGSAQDLQQFGILNSLGKTAEAARTPGGIQVADATTRVPKQGPVWDFLRDMFPSSFEGGTPKPDFTDPQNSPLNAIQQMPLTPQEDQALQNLDEKNPSPQDQQMEQTAQELTQKKVETPSTPPVPGEQQIPDMAQAEAPELNSPTGQKPKTSAEALAMQAQGAQIPKGTNAEQAVTQEDMQKYGQPGDTQTGNTATQQAEAEKPYLDQLISTITQKAQNTYQSARSIMGGAFQTLKQQGLTDEQATQQILNNGGATIDQSGMQPKQGYAYSPYKGREVVVPKDQFTAAKYHEYYDQNKDLLQQPGNHISAWEEDGKIWMDVSQVGAPTRDTYQKAIDAQQEGVYNLKTGETYYTPHSEKYGTQDDNANPYGRTLSGGSAQTNRSGIAEENAGALQPEANNGLSVGAKTPTKPLIAINGTQFEQGALQRIKTSIVKGNQQVMKPNYFAKKVIPENTWNQFLKNRPEFNNHEGGPAAIKNANGYFTYLDPQQIKPDPNNMNPVIDRRVAKQFQTNEPLIVRKMPDGTLQKVDGQHRLLSAQALGQPHVPAVVLDDSAAPLKESYKTAKQSNLMPKPQEQTDMDRGVALKQQLARSGQLPGGKEAQTNQDLAMQQLQQQRNVSAPEGNTPTDQQLAMQQMRQQQGTPAQTKVAASRVTVPRKLLSDQKSAQTDMAKAQAVINAKEKAGAPTQELETAHQKYVKAQKKYNQLGEKIKTLRDQKTKEIAATPAGNPEPLPWEAGKTPEEITQPEAQPEQQVAPQSPEEKVNQATGNTGILPKEFNPETGVTEKDMPQNPMVPGSTRPQLDGKFLAKEARHARFGSMQSVTFRANILAEEAKSALKTNQDNMNFRLAIEDPKNTEKYAASSSNPVGFKNLAKNYNTFTDHVFSQISKGPANVGYIEDYFTHIWDLSTPEAQKTYEDIMGGVRNSQSGFTKQRMIATLKQGLAAGLKLKNPTVAQDIGQYAQSMAKQIGADAMNSRINELRPGGAVAMKQHGSVPYNYQGSPFRQSNVPGNQGTFIDPEIQAHMGSYEPSAFANNKVVKGIDAANQGLKFTQLSGGGFHALNTTKNALVTDPTIIPRAVANSFSPQARISFMQKAVNDGVVDFGGKVGVTFGQNLDVLKPGETTLDKIQSKNPMVAFHRGLFDGLINTYKVNAVRNMMSKFDLTDPAQLQDARKYGAAINNVFGGLNYEALGRNKTIQQISRFGLLAPDYNEGKVRQLGNALNVKDWSKGANYNRLAALGPVIALAIISQIGQKLVTGKFDNNMSSFIQDSIIQPQIPLPNNKYFNNPKTGITQSAKLPGTIVSDVANAAVDFPHFVQARGSAVIGAAGSLISGQNYYGQPLVSGNKPDTLINRAVALAPQRLPIPAVNALSVAQGRLTPADAAINTAGDRVAANPNDPKYKEEQQYFNGINQAAAKLDTNDQKIFLGQLHPTTRDSDGNPIVDKNVLTTPAKYETLLENPKVLAAEQSFQKSQAGHDPLWDLNPQQLHNYMQAQVISKNNPVAGFGSSNPQSQTVTALYSTLPGSFWTNRNNWFATLPQTSGVSANNYKAQAAPQVEPAAITNFWNSYDALPYGTGARTAMLKTSAGVAAIAYTNNIDAANQVTTNQQRIDLGLPVLNSTSGGSSGSGGYSSSSSSSSGGEGVYDANYIDRSMLREYMISNLESMVNQKLPNLQLPGNHSIADRIAPNNRLMPNFYADAAKTAGGQQPGGPSKGGLPIGAPGSKSKGKATIKAPTYSQTRMSANSLKTAA